MALKRNTQKSPPQDHSKSTIGIIAAWYKKSKKKNQDNNQKQYQGKKIITLALVYAWGIVVYYESTAIEIPIAIGIAAIAGSIWAIGKKVFRKQRLATYWLCLLPWVCMIGYGNAWWEIKRVNTPTVQQKISGLAMEGTIAQIEKRITDWQLHITHMDIPAHRAMETPIQQIRLNVKEGNRNEELKVGDRVQFYGMLAPPLSQTTPYGYDFALNAYMEGVGAQGFVWGKVKIKDEDAYKPTWKAHMQIPSLQHYYSRHIENVLKGQTSAVAKAMLLGLTKEIKPETRQAYQKAGLAHTLAISGLHIGLIGICVFWVFRLLLSVIPAIALRMNTKKIAAVITIPILVFYAMMIGWPIPATRATLMMIIALIAIMRDNEPLSIRSITLVGLGMLFIKPHLLMNLSFQLSFTAMITLALVVQNHQRKYKGKESRGYKVLTGLKDTMVISGWLTLTLMPLSAKYFGGIPTYGILSNMIGIPLLGYGIIPMGLLGMLLTPIGWQGIPWQIMGLGIDGLSVLAHSVSQWQYTVMAMPPIPTSVSYGWLILGSLIILWDRQRKILMGIGLLYALGCIMIPRPILILSPINNTIAYYQQGQWALSTKHPSAFLKSQLIRYDGHNQKDLYETLGCNPKEDFCAITPTMTFWTKSSIQKQYMMPCPSDGHLHIMLNIIRKEQNPCPYIIDGKRLYEQGAIAVYDIAGKYWIAQSSNNKPWHKRIFEEEKKVGYSKTKGKTEKDKQKKNTFPKQKKQEKKKTKSKKNREE